MKSFAAVGLLASVAVASVAGHNVERRALHAEKMIKRRAMQRRGEIGAGALLLTVPNATASTSEVVANTTAAAPAWHKGTALWFVETGAQSACYTVHNDTDLVVGLSTEFWKNTGVVSDYCGQYLVVRNPATGANVTALISDASGKEYTTLTKAAFRTLAPLSVGMVDVEYYFLGASNASVATAPIAAANSTASSAGKAFVSSAAPVVAAASPATTTEAPVTTSARITTTSAQPTTTEKPTTTTPAVDYASISSKSSADAAASAKAAKASADAAAAAASQAASQAAEAAASKASAAAAKASAAAAAQAAKAQQEAQAQAQAAQDAANAAKAQAQAEAQAAAQKAKQSAPSSNEISGGIATYFTQNGNAGNCGTVHSDGAFGVALPTAAYQGGAHCYNNVVITRVDTGAKITAQVWDSCPTCNNNACLDLSVGAFQALGGTDSMGVFDITYHFA